MKLSEEQKIAAKLGEFDPVSELLKDEQEKIASAIEKSSDYLGRTPAHLLKKAGLGAPALSQEEAQDKSAGASTKRLIYDKIWPEGKDYHIGGPRPMWKKKKDEKDEKDEKKEASEVKEAQPPAGAPGMAAGGGAPQMMQGQMPQMGSPEMQAQQALMDAEAMKADPLEAQNETLRKVIQNQKLKLELAELSTKAQQAAMPPQVGPEAGPEAGGDGQMQGDPMEYMRQALSQ